MSREELGKKQISEEEIEDVTVIISFAYHDLEQIADGDDEAPFFISKDEWKKIEEYYAKPWGHYIGIMINLEMPKLKERFCEEVSSWATDVFITNVRLYDPEKDSYFFDFMEDTSENTPSEEEQETTEEHQANNEIINNEEPFSPEPLL